MPLSCVHGSAFGKVGREKTQENSLFNDGHSMFFCLWLTPESWHCLAQISTDLRRVQSFFLLICQSGLIFQQAITWMQPAQLQASLWEASDAELRAVVGRETESRCGTELQEPFEDIWRSACCSWVRSKGCISDRAYLLPQPSNISQTNQCQNHNCWFLEIICPCLTAWRGHPKKQYTAQMLIKNWIPALKYFTKEAPV